MYSSLREQALGISQAANFIREASLCGREIGAQCQLRGFLGGSAHSVLHHRAQTCPCCIQSTDGWGRRVKWDLRNMCREIKAFVLHEEREVR